MRDISIASISHVCKLDESYKYCILQRLHLLEKCALNITSTQSDALNVKIAEGLYYMHFRKWLSIVSKEDFLFLTIENLSQDPRGSVRLVQHFLGLSTSFIDNIIMAGQTCDKNKQLILNYHKKTSLQMRGDTKQLLKTFYSPFNMLLFELIGKEFLWE